MDLQTLNSVNFYLSIVSSSKWIQQTSKRTENDTMAIPKADFISTDNTEAMFVNIQI
jgi:hypothetical protein